MVVYEDGCVSCGLVCLHESCPNYRVKYYVCDKCGAEDTLYEFDGEQLCADCIISQLDVVQE